VRIVEQIFRLHQAKNRRNILCIARFFDKIRQKICRQDVHGDLIIGYFSGNIGFFFYFTTDPGNTQGMAAAVPVYSPRRGLCRRRRAW
jgi:hypothetical protein